MKQPYVEVFTAIVCLSSTENRVLKLFPIRRSVFSSRCDGFLLLASKYTSDVSLVVSPDVSPYADLQFLCRKTFDVFAQKSLTPVHKDP